MQHGELDSFYTLTAGINQHYFNHPFEYWRAIPFGEQPPSDFFRRPVGSLLDINTCPAIINEVMTVYDPKSMADILNVLNTVGHVALEERYPHRLEQLLKGAQYERAAEVYLIKKKEIANAEISEEQRLESYKKLDRYYRQSYGYRIHVGAEMLYEYEAWRETIPLLESTGLMTIFETRGQELLDYMCWAIKTRIDSSDAYQ